MPECIEVAWTVDCLKQLIIGKKFFTSKVSNVFSHGKQLFIELNNNTYINIHFGLTGYLSIYPDQHYHRNTLQFDNISIYYYDKVHFGKVQTLNKDEYAKKIEKLGLNVMDLNDFTLTNFKKVITGKKVSIVKFLMEQKYISGIGNYLKSEILYQARINPHTKVNNLSNIQIINLYNCIRLVVYNAYLMGFTNQHIKEYNQIGANFNMEKIPLSKTAEEFQIKNPTSYTFQVYEKEYDPKGNTVIKEEIDGRATFYVPHLQPDMTYIKVIKE